MSATSGAAALLAFRDALRGPTGTQLASWAGPLCNASWSGVTCTTNNMPTALSLAGLGLTGTLSCDMATVTSLTRIDLSRNLLSDSIPDCVATNMRSLTLLDLSRNQLTGVLPGTLGVLTGLGLSVFDNLV